MVISTPAGQFLCSGSLLTAAGKPFFLTAAHCVADENGVLWADQVDITLFPDPSGAVTRSTTERNRIFVHPSYDGEVISNFDIALIYLAGFGLESVPGLEFYELYSGPLTTEEYTVVGFGDRGDGVTGSTLPGGSRRQGFNQFDFLFGPGILVSDFDNGEPVNDGSALFGFPGLGLGARESSTAPGDSGGPVFFGNRIVGLTSFGATAGPVSDGGTDIDDDLNSSFGEFAGFVYTGFHRNWVESVAISIPEPSTGPPAVLAVTGILLIRRRRP